MKWVNPPWFLDFAPVAAYVQRASNPRAGAHRMSALSSLLDDLAARPGVLGVLVLSDDGLSVAQAGNDAAADELAAVGSAALRQLAQLGASTRQGKLQIGVLEYESGRVVIHPVRDDASLLLLVRRDVNVGTLLFALSADADALAALL